jgi:competence protein ComEC
MRRQVAVVALCAMIVLAGCADAGIGLGSPDGTDPPATPTGNATLGDDDPSAPNGSLEVHYVNVGQADATLLVSPTGETMLIDSGDWRDEGETVVEYLEARGIDRIDHLVSTHAHADHIGGHAELIEQYETEKEGVGAVYDSGAVHTSRTYEDYLDAVQRHDVTLYEVSEGDEIPFAGARATVLNPVEPGGDDLHANGVVLHVGYGETGFVFTGDAERDVEGRLVDAYGDDLEAEVYQAGHHGSNTSSGPAFLDAVDPEVAVVSSANDSQYGHPHDETLERLAARDVRTTWTAVHGTTVVVSDGSSLEVRTQHDATTDPLAVRDAEAATADPAESTEERFTVTADDAEARLAPPASVPTTTGGFA